MLNVNDEYSKLKKVLMGSVESFHLHPPINSTQEFYYKNDPPVLKMMIEEQKMFADLLKSFGVEVLWSEKRSDCTNQVNTRDVAFVAGQMFVICPMKEPERQNEHLTLNPLISTLDSKSIILRPKNGFIEGGDIIVDRKRLYVGISQRTNSEGLKWLQRVFSEKFEIIPVYLKKGFLHLDCVFNLLSCDIALVLEKGIEPDSLDCIMKNHEVIFVCPDEQSNLPTNVFSVSPEIVIADKRNKITNERIKATGKNVYELKYEESSKIGGSFRCSTCPLERED